MKNITTSNLFIIAIWIIFFASCATDESVFDPPEIIFPDPVETISSNITGSVEDESGLPISDALVICHNCAPVQEVQTDDKGDFQFFDVEVKGNSAYVSVKSVGKFDGFRRFGLIEGKVNYTRILLKDKTSLGTLSAQQGGILTHNSGAVISLPADGIVDASGQSYSGDYDVFISWIDPTAEDLNLRMVGDLSAIDAEGELVGLSTFGMLQVELEATDGSDLNIADGSTAILEFPVPQSLRGSAPAVIPLWNYNETHGYWVEEGSATLDGDKYVGEVSHFSNWNVDVKIDPVDICGSIVTGDFKKNLSYYQVKLSGDSFQGAGGWLCDDGSFRFINVPSGQTLTIEILNYCGELIETIDIGPYEPGKIELDPIIISDNNNVNFVQLTGNAIDCHNEILTEGFVRINLENDSYTFRIESDGTFDVSFPTCGEFEARIQLINTFDLSASIFFFITDQNQSYNFDDLQTCEFYPEEYFYLKYVDESISFDEEISLINPMISIFFSSPEEYQIVLTDSDQNSLMVIFIDGTPVENTEIIGAALTRITDPSSSQFKTFGEVRIRYNSVGPELSAGIFEHLEIDFDAVSINESYRYMNGSLRVKAD